MTIRVPLVLGFHCQYCIAQVKQNMHKYKVQLLYVDNSDELLAVPKVPSVHDDSLLTL